MPFALFSCKISIDYGEFMQTLNRMLILLLVLSCIGFTGCKGGREMPATSENIMNYLNKVDLAQKSVTPAEDEKAKTDEKASEQLIAKVLVTPMTEMGFDYDKTINSYARKVLEKNLPGDPRVQQMMIQTLEIANGVKEIIVKNGYITNDTKVLLDQLQSQMRR